MSDQAQTQFANCVICSGQAFGRMACGHCETKMRDQLTDILEFYALAEGELAPGRTGSGSSTETSIGVRIAALDFLAGHDVVAVLGLWEREWQEHYELTISADTVRPTVTLLSAVTFLKAWLPTACQSHPAIDDFAREVRENWSLARAAARRAPAQKHTITCPSDDDSREDGICGYRISINPEKLNNDVICKRCGTEWNPGHLIHVAISTHGAEVWVDPEAAAGYFKITTKTLREWARGEKIRRDHGRYEMHSIHLAIHGVSEVAEVV